MIALVLGGIRSGKSEVAEAMAAGCGALVTVVATAMTADDAEFAARIERHRARRPSSWRTIEEPHDLAGVLARTAGTVVIDALGTWVANAPGFTVDVDAVCTALRTRAGSTIVVSDEVGLSVHPPSDAGRRFADALGDCNRAVAGVADRMLFVVAGRTIELDAS